MILYALSLIGVAVFAASGALAAGRKSFDWIGVGVIAVVTAIGGGTLRDLLLDKRPFFWVEHQEYLWLVFAMSVAAIPFFRARHMQLTERAIQIPDALGLGLFSVLGASQALQAGLPALVAALMGVTTGVLGSVMRDVICNEIPTVFRDRRPYAVCAFVGCWAYLGAQAIGTPTLASLAVGFAVTAGLRLVALARGWLVPTWPGD
jgi:uncharacterized membrane protein YeiH